MLELDEKMVQELLNNLGEIPAKWSMNLIGSIQAEWNKQNPKEEEEVIIEDA